MLTSIGRAAARRVVTSKSIAFTTSLPLRPTATIIRPVAARSFTSSKWSRMATQSAGGSSTKKTSSTGTKKTTKAKIASKKPKATKKSTATKAKKKAAAKPAKKRVPLTSEQKESKKLKELKKASLIGKEPTIKPGSSWTVYVTENIGKLGTTSFSDKVKEIKASWDSLSASEKQSYELKATANAEENKKIIKDWVNSYPVEDIYLANLARVQLSKLLKKKKANKIVDDRAPKRPVPPYGRFLQSRLNSYNGSDYKDAFKNASLEWKSLRDTERRPFEETYAEEVAAYREEFYPLRERAKQRQKEVKASAKTSAKAT